MFLEEFVQNSRVVWSWLPDHCRETILCFFLLKVLVEENPQLLKKRDHQTKVGGSVEAIKQLLDAPVLGYDLLLGAFGRFVG